MKLYFHFYIFMKNFQEKVQSGFSLLKNKLSSSIQNILHTNKQKVQSILETPEASVIETQATQKDNLNECVETSKNLQPYSMEFMWEKIIVLWYENSNEIYKIFPASGGDFIHGNQADQITALFQTHKRAFFKKIKNSPKNKNYIKNIFKEIWEKNKSEQIKNSEITIQPKKSAAERIKENKRKKNLEAIEKRKQKQQEKIEAQKNKQKELDQQKHAQNIQSDYQTLSWFHQVAKILPWQNDFSKSLSNQEKQEKFQQISAASSIYKILMARLPKDIFSKNIWLDDTKRYTVLKEYIKNYLHQDFGDSQEIKNQQRHLLHLVNSACEILLLSKEYQKQNPPKNNTQWTNYYKNAA